MVTKIIELPQGPALLLDREMLREAGLQAETPVQVTSQNGTLLVEQIPPGRREQLQDVLQEVNDRYGDMLRRLAEGPGGA